MFRTRTDIRLPRRQHSVSSFTFPRIHSLGYKGPGAEANSVSPVMPETAGLGDMQRLYIPPPSIPLDGMPLQIRRTVSPSVGHIKLWAPSSGVRDVSKSITYVFTYNVIEESGGRQDTLVT
jgi:hypothetical protein